MGQLLLNSKRTAGKAVLSLVCCVCFRREKIYCVHRVGRTLCMSIRYPIIFTELCFLCEQFVNHAGVPEFVSTFSERQCSSPNDLLD